MFETENSQEIAHGTSLFLLPPSQPAQQSLRDGVPVHTTLRMERFTVLHESALHRRFAFDTVARVHFRSQYKSQNHTIPSRLSREIRNLFF